MSRRIFGEDPFKFIRQVVLQYTDRDRCLTWPFQINGAGYGQIWSRGKNIIASRLVCSLVYGAPPTLEHEAAHSCGKGHEACVNPHHLRWATTRENKADMIIHDTRTYGEKNSQAKLTNEKAAQIRALLNAGVHQHKIAAKFGIAQSSVSHIKCGKTWNWTEKDMALVNAQEQILLAAPDFATAALLALIALKNADHGDPSHETGWESDESCEAYCALWKALEKAGIDPRTANPARSPNEAST